MENSTLKMLPDSQLRHTLWMDKSDHLSLSVVANDDIFSVLEWKIHSEIRGKERENNICRVLCPTQICQFWDTELPT